MAKEYQEGSCVIKMNLQTKNESGIAEGCDYDSNGDHQLKMVSTMTG